MVYAFIIHTRSPKGCDILYYRVFSCYSSEEKSSNSDAASRETDSKGILQTAKIFDTSSEKKELLEHVVNKVHMQYSMKTSCSVLPTSMSEDYKDAFAKGIFMERHWKGETGLVLPIVWQCCTNLGFVLVCSKKENYLQAQNILDIIIQQLEKHLQFASSPLMAMSIVETVALIVNHYLPAGQLLFMNSKLTRQYEKQLETDLFSK